MNRSLLTALAFSTWGTLGGTALAADFHPISGLGTNMTDGNAGGNPLSNIIQGPGVGFSATEPHDGPSDTWYTDAPGGFPSDYVQVHAGPEYLWFDLGMDVALAEISYWGYATTNANGVRGFNLSFATDAEGGAPALGDEDYGTSITANPAFEALIDNVPRQSFTFDAVVARYVRVEVTSTHITNGGNGPPAGGDRVGIGEIAFEKVVAPPDAQISVPAAVELALTTSAEVFEITISNVGGAELTISGASVTGPNAGAFSVQSFPASIPSLSSGTIEVGFDPAGLVGPVSAILQIASNDADTPTAEVQLTGTVPPTEPDILVPDPVDRGSIAGIDTFDLTVSNGGGSALTISGADFTGPNAAAFSVVSAPASIAALSSEDFTIRIDPGGLDGPITATLEIASDDPDTPVAQVLISAIALGDAAQFYPISSAESSTAGNDLWPVSNLIQGPGVGFDAARPHDKILDGAAGNWVTAAPGGFPSDYIAVAGMPVLIFDLGQNVGLCEISIWGYASTNSNGLSEFSLRFATEAEGTANFGTSIDYNPTFAGIDSGLLPNEDNTSRFSFLFERQVNARYVELTCVDNHFIAPGNVGIPGGDRVGIGEVAFEITSCEAPRIPFRVEGDGDNLVLTWDSQGGKLYNVRSVTDFSVPIPPGTEPPVPLEWPIFDGNVDIAATPPENTLTIPRPGDPERYFVIEEFNAPPVAVFSDDFENGQGSWTAGVDDANGNTAWEFGAPGAPGPASANSGANCFGTNLTAVYGEDANVWLRSPIIDLTTAGGATLNYASWFDIEPSFDLGTVNVLDSNDNLLVALQTDIDGTSTDWEQVRLPLPAAAVGQQIKLEFRFESDNFNTFPQTGWYIDDVVVTVP